MRKVLLFIFSISTLISFAQQDVDYSKYYKEATRIDIQKLDTYLSDVYQSHKSEIITQDLYNAFKNLLNNRLRVAELTTSEIGKVRKISHMGLLNKYNPSMQMDESFNVETFNPLKYNLAFFSSEQEVYQIGNSNFIIIILPR